MYSKTIELIIDHREKASGIPEFLINKIPNISFKNLKAGDYLIPQKNII